MKQYSHACHEKLQQALIQFGFSSTRYNHSLFVYNHNNITLSTLIYVYYILIAWYSSKRIHNLINKLNLKFTFKQLGAPRYFLGVEVHSQPGGSLLLSQTKYIHDFLNR